MPSHDWRDAIRFLVFIRGRASSTSSRLETAVWLILVRLH
jgi:hypothetical protein